MKFADDFVEYCREFTACPEVFLKWSAVLALSAVAGRKHVMRRGDWDVYPNLWVLLLGNSSSYKSTGLAAMRRILFEAQPGVLGGQEYSHEKFIEDLAANPHKLYLYDEAESYFNMFNQSYNVGMKSLWLTLWTGNQYRREIKGKDGQGQVLEIKDAYLCWGGASTSIQVANQMRNGSSDLLSGFLPRFVMVPYFDTETDIEDPPPADRAKRTALAARLRFLANTGERIYTYTPEALSAKKLWLKQFKKRLDGCDPLLGAFFKKLRDEHFHKIAMLSAFDRGVTDIAEIDVTEAAAYLWPVEKNWPDLLSRLTEKEWDRDVNRVEVFIKTNHKVDRSDILRATRNIRAQKLTAILDGLAQDGLISVSTEPTEKKPRTVIEWTK